MAWFETSTDLWYDADGQICECDKPMSFFYVSDDETGNVTIDGVRASGVDAAKVVYIASQDGRWGHGYNPTVREMYDSAIARARKVVGVTAHPAQIDDRVGVYTTGVVKVQVATGPTGSYSHTVQAGHFVMGTYGGDVISAPAATLAAGQSWIDARIGTAYQSAGSGDEFLVKLRL